MEIKNVNFINKITRMILPKKSLWTYNIRRYAWYNR